ncbi:MAG: exo-beta-N-acetylmuramidase NamZ family protein [Bacteroidota bacterium]
MNRLKVQVLLLTVAVLCFQCSRKVVMPVTTPVVQPMMVGAGQLDMLTRKLSGKRVALVVNHTALVGKTHLADTLKSKGITPQKIFAPEHGFRGTADAGEHVKDAIDVKTGLPVISLYGSNRKPTPEQLADVDLLIFDIQDVGVRFYTYISTLHYVMEACAEQGKKLMVLDRPNPNGGYVDGPVLQLSLKSFVGMHPLPVVHGLTVGELAMMINGEGWLAQGKKCDLEVITVKNWKHQDAYSLPARPSPNLPNDQAIKLYPSLCLFEGTVISVGRGTETPFQIIGNPELRNMPFQFTPVSIDGMAKNPPFENKTCYGLDLRSVAVQPKFTLEYLIDMYSAYPDKDKFFNNFFDKLAGNTELKQQIKDGLTEEAIRETWKKDLEAYKQLRAKYLLYP